MNLWSRTCLLWVLFLYRTSAWPDGAPCIRAAYESMNPLEAVEHQGGLQLTPPPFKIEVQQKCYWLNQPIELTLKGNTTKNLFKGFAIQPYVYEGVNAGQKIGQFLRLDDNGSWRQQCFQKKDSVTHSHDERKKHITLWWKNDQDDSVTVQFVGTVVVALRQFWVKSVLSVPIPSCKERQDMTGWQSPPITAPPPVGRFKIDTFQMFNQQNSAFLERSFANERPLAPVARPMVTMPQSTLMFTTSQPLQRPEFVGVPVQPPVLAPVRRPLITFQQNPFMPQGVQPAGTRPSAVQSRQKLTHVIPLANMETIKRPQQNSELGQSSFLVSSSTSMRPSSQCFDREPLNQCLIWLQFCQSSTFMRLACQRSCRFC